MRRAGKPSASKLGSFLVQSQLQTSVNSSAMFLTAAAQNLLCMKLAAELGVLVPSPWVTWFYAAALPALIGIIVTPFLMFKVSWPPSDLHPRGPVSDVQGCLASLHCSEELPSVLCRFSVVRYFCCFFRLFCTAFWLVLLPTFFAALHAWVLSFVLNYGSNLGPVTVCKCVGTIREVYSIIA